MMDKLSSLLVKKSRPLQVTVTALGSSSSDRLIHPKCVKDICSSIMDQLSGAIVNIYLVWHAVRKVTSYFTSLIHLMIKKYDICLQNVKEGKCKVEDT